MKKRKTRLVLLKEALKADPNDYERKAIYEICIAIIKEELNEIRHEIRSELLVYHQFKGEEYSAGIFKAVEVEKVFNYYLENLENLED